MLRPYRIQRLDDGRPHPWVILTPKGEIVAACSTRKAAQASARHRTHRARERVQRGGAA
jgi:hypothetical protein